jgi:hypothetical protein
MFAGVSYLFTLLKIVNKLLECTVHNHNPLIKRSLQFSPIHMKPNDGHDQAVPARIVDTRMKLLNSISRLLTSSLSATIHEASQKAMLKLLLCKPRNTITRIFGSELISRSHFPNKGILLMDAEDNNSFSNLLIYNDEQKRLELNGYPLQRGEKIELRLMGYWIAGTIQSDAGGWYLLTYDYVGIRLNAGLTARRPRYVLTIPPPREQFPSAFS